MVQTKQQCERKRKDEKTREDTRLRPQKHKRVRKGAENTALCQRYIDGKCDGVLSNPLGFIYSLFFPARAHDYTSVALVNDTTMYLSGPSSSLDFRVHTALGKPGSSDTANSWTLTPCRKIRKLERAPRPQHAKIWGLPSPHTSATRASVMGAADSSTSTTAKLFNLPASEAPARGRGHVSPKSERWKNKRLTAER